MKKIITIIVAVVLTAVILFVISWCQKHNSDSHLETADSAFEVSNAIGTVTVTEDVAKTMLGQYSEKILGISKPINEYVMKLSPTRLFNEDACLVELFLNESDESASATFAILGYDCFVYDIKKDEFLLLTLNGAFSVEITTTVQSEESTTALFYDIENDKKLHKLLDEYTASELGFKESPADYKIVATGGMTVADDGETVFILRMYLNDGTKTNYTCAFNDSGVYKYDTSLQKYVKLDK